MTQEVMIQIFESDFNKDGLVQTVNARDLHEALGVGWDFSTWIKDNLKDFKENQDFIIFQKKLEKSKGRPFKEYALTLDTAKHICMLSRCEKGRQLRQYFIEVEKQYRLGYAAEPAAPQQQQQLAGTPGTPEHFLDFITQGVTQALTQAYREYFGEPVKTALTDQQQHTEPVELAEDKTLPPGYTYKHHPDNEICFSEMEPYVSNPDLRKELIAIFEFKGREHNPGSRKEKGNIFKAKPYTVYKKADVLPVLKAVQRWKLNNSGEKLLGRGFSFKEELSATDYQGEKFDEAYAKLQDLNDKYLKEKQDKKRAKKQAKQK